MGGPEGEKMGVARGNRAIQIDDWKPVATNLACKTPTPLIERKNKDTKR